VRCLYPLHVRCIVARRMFRGRYQLLH
jgi:hypothetical protein